MFVKIVFLCLFALFGASFARDLTDLDFQEILSNANSKHRIHLPSPREAIKYVPKKNQRDAELFWGELTLFGGIGWGVLDFVQNGPIIRYKDDPTRYDIPVYYKNLTYEYEYEMNVSLFDNEGIVWGYMSDLEMTIPVTYVNGVFKLHHTPEVPDHTRKLVVFKDGGLLEDTISNYLHPTYNSIVFDMLCSIYFRFYCNQFVDQLNHAIKISKKRYPH